MNVTRVPYAVLDKDGGELAAQYIADLEGTGIFRRQATAATEKDIDRPDRQRDICPGPDIPPDFSAICKRGGPPRSSSLETARNTNTAAIALSYAQQIASNFGAELLAKNAAAPRLK